MSPELYDPVVVIVLAAIASYVSRGLGAMLSGRLDPQGSVVEWITCITYALMAGLVVRMLILPIGALTQAPDWVRLLAAGVGLLIFFVFRKNVGLGVAAGSATLALLTW
ncbi:MAG: hypothetical protein COB46_05160 [Rhodospirillaceae bacterium]|nr:MAG: hypothetical protein COB46_05160 [Rhodospirillaceae bacterium]